MLSTLFLLVSLAIPQDGDFAVAREKYFDEVRAKLTEEKLDVADLANVEAAIAAVVAVARPETFTLLSKDAATISARLIEVAAELGQKRAAIEHETEALKKLEGDERKAADEKLKEKSKRVEALTALRPALALLRDALHKGLLDAHAVAPADPAATFDALMKFFPDDSADVLEEERAVEKMEATLKNLRERLPGVTDDAKSAEMERDGSRIASELEVRSEELKHRVALRDRRIQALAALYPQLEKSLQDKIRSSLRSGLRDDTPWEQRALNVEILSHLAIDDAADQILTAMKHASKQRRDLEKELVPFRVTYDRALKALMDQARGSGGLVSQNSANTEKALREQLQDMSRKVYGEGRVMDAAERGLGVAVSKVPADKAKKAVAMIVQVVEREGDPEIKGRGVGALGYVQGDAAGEALLELAGSTRADVELRVRAIDALARSENASLVALCVNKLLKDSDWRVRASAMDALVRVPTNEAVPALITSVGVEVGRLVDDAEAALHALTGRRFNGDARLWRDWWEKNEASFDVASASSRGEGAAAGAAGTPDWKDVPGHVSFYGITTRSTKVLFVLDRSGSMNEPIGEGVTGSDARIKIDAAKSQLKGAVAGLSDGDLFNIITYSADVTRWQKYMQKKSTTTHKKVEKYIDTEIEAIGGTNIFDALAEAFRLAGIGAQDRAYDSNVDTIFFLSDGNPTQGEVQDTEEILKRVREWNKISRIVVHVVGVGKDHDAVFMRRLAEENGGTYVNR